MIFGSDAKVVLFGSRVDDDKRGGDIDLLVKCTSEVTESGLKSAQLSARIQRQIGEQKIDVLCIWPGVELMPVHKSALEHGIEL